MSMAFGGAHFDYDNYNLKDSPILAAHFIHSIIWLQYCNGKINYNKRMSVDSLYLNNQSFFKMVVEKYAKERNFTIEIKSIKAGIKWFLTSAKIDD